MEFLQQYLSPDAIEAGVEQLVEMSTYFGLRIIGALLLLIVGFWAARMVSGSVQRALSRSRRIDKTLVPFLSSLVRYAILAFVVIAVLSTFGIETTSLIAAFGAAGLAIGLALQGTLSNIAAGVMLLIFRPFKVDDYIEVGGLAGTVNAISLFVTELTTPDNVQIIVPNSDVWGKPITNFSYHDRRRLDLRFGIDYGDDIAKAKEILLDLAREDERVLGDPEPWVRVVNLGDSSVDLGCRFWCKASDYWELKWHLTQSAKEAFDAGGISIPYPHQVEIAKAG